MKKPYRAQYAPSWWMGKGSGPGQGGKHNYLGVDLPWTDKDNNLPVKKNSMFPIIEDTSAEFGIKSRPGVTVSSHNSNVEKTVGKSFIKDGKNLLPSLKKDGNTGQCRWTPTRSKEYYKDDCCAIQSFLNFANSTNSPVHQCGILDYYFLNCANSPYQLEPALFCNSKNGEMMNFVYWYMSWLLTKPSEYFCSNNYPIIGNCILDSPPASGLSCKGRSCLLNTSCLFSLDDSNKLPQIIGDNYIKNLEQKGCGSVCQSPIPMDIITLDICVYPCYAFFKNVYDEKNGMSVLTDGEKAVVFAKAWWHNLIMPAPSTSPASFSPSSPPPPKLQEYILNSMTNYKPEILLNLRKQINEKLDKNQTVILFVNEAFLNSPVSIYMKRSFSAPGTAPSSSSSMENKYTYGITEIIINNTLPLSNPKSGDNIGTNLDDIQKINYYVNIILHSLVVNILNLQLLKQKNGSTPPENNTFFSQWENLFNFKTSSPLQIENKTTTEYFTEYVNPTKMKRKLVTSGDGFRNISSKIDAVTLLQSNQAPLRLMGRKPSEEVAKEITNRKRRAAAFKAQSDSASAIVASVSKRRSPDESSLIVDLGDISAENELMGRTQTESDDFNEPCIPGDNSCINPLVLPYKMVGTIVNYDENSVISTTESDNKNVILFTLGGLRKKNSEGKLINIYTWFKKINWILNIKFNLIYKNADTLLPTQRKLYQEQCKILLFYTRALYQQQNMVTMSEAEYEVSSERAKLIQFLENIRDDLFAITTANAFYDAFSALSKKFENAFELRLRY